MSYTLEALAADIHRELARDQSAAAKEAVCRHVSRALTDPEFVATHLKDKPSGSDPREILYEDPQLGFCICGHVYPNKAIGSPHDHGASWAIYGAALEWSRNKSMPAEAMADLVLPLVRPALYC